MVEPTPRVDDFKYGDYVNIPGWDDIVHVRPRARISDEEMQEHRRRKKAKEKSNLSERQLEEIQKRRERYLRIKNSPTPEIVRSIGTVMTALDDVEDSLITAAVIGRLAVKILPRLMGRFVPVLGWCLLAADIINLFQIMSWLPFSFTSAKRSKESLSDRNPLGRVAKLKRLKRLKRVVPTIGEGLEVAQTTDQLFGVGICLGSIMGFVQDCAFGVYRDLKYVMTPSEREMPNRGFFNAMRSTMVACQTEQELTDEEHTNIIVASYMAQSHLKPILNKMDWFAAAKEYAKVPIKPPPAWDPATKYILEDAGEDIEATSRWPLAGNPDKVSLARFAEEGFKRINDSLSSYVERMKRAYEGYVASDCLHRGLYDCLEMWEGHTPYAYDFYERDAKRYETSVNTILGGKSLSNPVPSFSPEESSSINKKILEKTMTPHERITMQMLEYGILPQPDTPNEHLLYYVDKVAGQETSYDVRYTEDELVDSYTALLGVPRRYFPVYPKLHTEGFLPDPEQWSESFRRNMSDKAEVLWPNWELVPEDLKDYYRTYGLL